LIVDPSNYGENGTLETNALSADSLKVTGKYAQSQSAWGSPELLWARGTTDGVYAARGDLTKAFVFSGQTTSDISYAHREWTMLPEGEIAIIDRVHTADASNMMRINFKTNTRGGGGLLLSGNTASGIVGNSQVAIHLVSASNGALPTITQPAVQNTYAYPCAQCTNARFAVDNYGMLVPGPWAVAIHVIDGLGKSEAPAVVGSINDDTNDPAPKQNFGVIGTSVLRNSVQSYVVASSAVDATPTATMTYTVSGATGARHVVYDAPEDGSGKSVITTKVISGRCNVSITAGSGAGSMVGHPLIFNLADANHGCAATAAVDAVPTTP
jgi:hypothetical protein